MSLRQYAYAWDAAEMAPPQSNRTEFPPLPDGNYYVRLERAEVTASRKTGEPMVSLGFLVESGEFAGRWVWKHQTITSDPTRLSYLKRDLAYLGVGTARAIDYLPDELASVTGATTTVDLRTRVGRDGVSRQNVYINPPEGWTPPDGVEVPL